MSACFFGVKKNEDYWDGMMINSTTSETHFDAEFPRDQHSAHKLHEYPQACVWESKALFFCTFCCAYPFHIAMNHWRKDCSCALQFLCISCRRQVLRWYFWPAETFMNLSMSSLTPEQNITSKSTLFFPSPERTRPKQGVALPPACPKKH